MFNCGKTTKQRVSWFGEASVGVSREKLSQQETRDGLNVQNQRRWTEFEFTFRCPAMDEALSLLFKALATFLKALHENT